MNKSESKYFHTAEKMDEAFLDLLDEKDFEFITVKEICAKAHVNRSTFYLHYETMNDLLQESIEYFFRRFASYFSETNAGFLAKIKEAPVSELNLITPKYLRPYLQFIQDHQKQFLLSITKASTMNSDDNFSKLCTSILYPILERYHVTPKEGDYILAYYIGGMSAVIQHWLAKGCADSIDYVMAFILQFVPGKEF